jgi:TolA-binding protein
MRDVEASRRQELGARLERCRTLYEEDRYRAAECLASFLRKYGRSPLAAEGYMLVGILRMDYALDYRAADMAFQEFLRRSPRHPRAELAMYRLWLSATEDGRIGQAIERGRQYLERFPQGRYVGKIIQRFPELKAAI